ncbi:hypothetical protein BLS_005833 [Venturia inaequalis]|uniref:Probable methionine--tRNA ligase, mitochondrial n=1 Tax=Venturia inaequalis TaxID=5025 RepID=A0A8H3Z288_VENIN|nr:hypothetical protein BLS_005833 [Venturia inaequalis]
MRSILNSSALSLLKKNRKSRWICSSCQRNFATISARRNDAPFKVTLSQPISIPKSKPFYVTTPIFYVNAAPHVGHMYTMVLTDIIKRWQVLGGRKALLLTGTDEHGMKIQQAAEKARSDPLPFCDKGADIFKDLAAQSDISYDHFIRTTDADHKEAVQYAWHILQQKELIYTSKHKGWYSVSDETFYPPSSVHLVVEPATGRKHMASMETGKEVEWTEEENYHFRLSAFRDQLLEFYEANPGWIIPKTRHLDIENAVKAGLDDLSISRPSSRLTWGIPVPEDPSQTIYVWLDALVNYITKAGYPWSPDKSFDGGWPADVQVIGKDITRFHCIYWPAFLMALDLPLPSHILTHAHWTLGKEKMAKSTGNVVNPFFALDRFGVDVMRFYLAHDGGIGQDADYTNDNILERHRVILQGQLGNLASRLIRGKGWNLQSVVGNMGRRESWKPTDDLQWTQLNNVAREVGVHMETYQVGLALKRIVRLLSKTNVYITEQEPWQLVKQLKTQPNPETSEKLDEVLFLCTEALRIAGILLQPYMPTKAALLLDMLGVEENKRSLEFAKPSVDFTYGESKVPVGKSHEGVLFPPLA